MVFPVQLNRKDLTNLKVYAIDVDEADEVFVAYLTEFVL